MRGIRLNVRQLFIRLDAVALVVSIIQRLVEFSPRDPQHGVPCSRVSVGPQALETLKRQVVVAQVDADHQDVVIAIQNLRRNRCDVVTTQIQDSEVGRIQHAPRPLRQNVIAQIECHQRFENVEIEGDQFVVAQVKTVQTFQIAQRGVQVFGITQPVRSQFKAFERTHVLDRLGYGLQPIAVEFQGLEPGKGGEEPVGACPGQYYTGQVQPADVLERCRHLREITQLQAAQIQYGIGYPLHASQAFAPAFEDAQGAQPANA
ncbi:hypothetical protein D3C71_1205180 [compost metagenome]